MINTDKNMLHRGIQIIRSEKQGNCSQRTRQKKSQALYMQIRKCKNITSKQPLNWIRIIQVGNIQGYFEDLKIYFSLSKLIQSLFKLVFI